MEFLSIQKKYCFVLLSISLYLPDTKTNTLMKTKTCLFVSISAIMLISLLLSTQQLCAQEIKTKNGLTTISYSTDDGDITIYIPRKMPKGGKISGSILLKANSEKPKKKEKQLKQLLDHEFIIGDISINGKGLFTINLPDSENLDITLSDPHGKKLFSETLILNKPFISAKTYIPKIIRKAYTEKITCPSAGSFKEIDLLIDEKQAEIIALNQSEVFYKCPDMEPGKANVIIKTDKVMAEEEVNITELRLSVGKADLLKGEQTILAISIYGLEDIDEELDFSLTNESPGIIAMEGGKEQIIVIPPEEITNEGEWEKRITLTGRQRGNFAITAGLEIPQEPKEEFDEPQPIVDCELNGYPVLVPADVCEELQNGIEEFDESGSGFPEEEYPEMPPVSEFVEVPETIEPGEQLPVNIEISEGVIPHHVIFYIYSLSDEIIQEVFVDSIAANGFGFEGKFNYEPGIYGIEARITSGTNRLETKTTFFIQKDSLCIEEDTPEDLYSISQEIENVDREAANERRRIQRNERQKNENNRRAYSEDSTANIHGRIARELSRIDQVLDNTENTYNKRMKALLDSIVRFPPIPDTALLRKQFNYMDSASKACNRQLKRLRDEKKALEKELPQNESKRLKAYHNMTDLFKRSGYNFIAHRKYNDQGDLEYGYGFVFGSGGNKKLYKDVVPIELVSELRDYERQIRELNKRNRDIRKRLNELPGIIESAEKECNRLNAELNKARKALDDAINLAGDYNHLQLQRDEMCRQIKNLLNRLVIWCNNNQDICIFRSQLDNLMKECPNDSIQARQFWNRFNQIIQSKKGIENRNREEARKHRDNANDLKRQARQNDDNIDDARDKLRDLADKRKELQKKQKEAAAAAERQRIENERRREQEKKEEMENCIRKFAEWIAKNQQYLKDDNLEDLKPVVEGVSQTGQAFTEFVSRVLKGSSVKPAALSGIGSGLINLGAALFYGWVQGEAQSAVKNIGDKKVLELINAELINDNRKCGVIDPKGATSYFFFRSGNKLLVFRISATFGFEYIGEK